VLQGLQGDSPADAAHATIKSSTARTDGAAMAIQPHFQGSVAVAVAGEGSDLASAATIIDGTTDAIAATDWIMQAKIKFQR